MTINIDDSRSRGYKGIPGFRRQSKEKLLKAAHDSPYYWWWRFLKLSPVFWYAQKTGLKPINSEVARTLELASDLQSPMFSSWWQKHGQYLFAEAHAYPEVRLIDVDKFAGHDLYRKSIVLEIPLNITRKKAMSEIRKHLVENKQGQIAEVLGLSSAQFKLYTKRHHPSTLENEFWVLVYKILFPEITNWKLCDRLQLAPHIDKNAIKLRLTANRHRGSDPIALMQSLVGRNLYKARFARHHVERGSFPNYTKVDLKSVATPFGIKHHSDYLDATSETSMEYSAWQQHLSKLYLDDLKYKILHKNRLDKHYIENSEFKANMLNYMAGIAEANQN